ncbi:MAG: RHS repeat-associated core domain-containing protein [Fibrella sp.]|nr:RHS repeat-associated core domain-containing protein [Armatimonadota bacterium]
MEFDGSGNVMAVNTFGANGVIARRENNASKYYLFDERGSAVQRVDASTGVTDFKLTDGYGTSVAGANVDDPYFGFGGQWGYYTDTETQMVLCHLRHYDPTNGRWLTKDPIQQMGGTNVYEYCRSSPTSLVDPFGLQHAPGGPWHPSPGWAMGCKPGDSCSEISRTMDRIRKSLLSHIKWDISNPTVGWPDGRHYDDIANLIGAYNNCMSLHWANCKKPNRFQVCPVPRPVPAPFVIPDWLPAVGGVIIAGGVLVIVCTLAPEICAVIAAGLIGSGGRLVPR